MGAFQAQDYAGAKWSLGLRLPGTTEAEIDQAVADRTIVRTWPMRGTLHFVPAADIAWMLELTTPRILAGSAARHRDLELDDRTFDRCRVLFAEALRGGRTRSRADLLQTLEDAGIPTGSQRGYHLLWRTAQEGLICFAPPHGKQPAFALLDEWIPESQRTVFADRRHALGELARRYFTSHGPATLQDFSWWSRLTAADARTGLEESALSLESVVFEGRTFWMPPTTSDTHETHFDDEPDVYLLPGFDEYLLGYKDRSAALDPVYARRIVPGGNGVFLPTIVSRGQVIGTWKRTVTKRSVSVVPEPFQPLSEAEEKALALAAERYREYLQEP